MSDEPLHEDQHTEDEKHSKSREALDNLHIAELAELEAKEALRLRILKGINKR